MKKTIIGLLSVGLVLGVGTTVFGNASDGEIPKNDEIPSFEEMAPYMQEVHPDWSEEDLESMYNRCHGSNNKFGPMRGGNFGPGQGPGAAYSNFID